MGSSRTTSAPTTTTQQADNRVAIGNDGANVGAFGRYWRDDSTQTNSNNTSTSLFQVADSRDYSNRSSVAVSDSSSHDYSNRSSVAVSDSSSRDYSNRSSSNTTTTITGTDGGSVQMAEWNAQLLGELGRQQTDAVRAVAAFGTQGINAQAAAATDLFKTGSAEAAAAWGHTLDRSYDAIDRLMASATATVTGAQLVAADAIHSYQPTANAQASADPSRALVLSAVAVAVLLALKKA